MEEEWGNEGWEEEEEERQVSSPAGSREWDTEKEETDQVRFQVFPSLSTSTSSH